MKVLLLFLAGFIWLSESNVIHSNALPTNRIINGYTNDIPHACYLYVRLSDNPLGYLGGGSIVTDRHIITAAHLVDNAKSIIIGYGGTNMNNMQARVTTNVIVHSQFVASPTDFDIAVVILPMFDKIVFDGMINSIALPPSYIPVTYPELGITGSIAGFGFSYEGQSTNSDLKIATATVVENTLCEQTYGNRELPNYFCAQDKTNNLPSNVCPGDNGSGFFVLLNGVRTLIGVTSFIPATCADTSNPAGYVRISMFRKWIANIIGI